MKTQHLLLLFALLTILVENVFCGRNGNDSGQDTSSLANICASTVEKRFVDPDASPIVPSSAQKLLSSDDYNSPLIRSSASLMHSGDIIVEPLNGRVTNESERAVKICLPIFFVLTVAAVVVICIVGYKDPNRSKLLSKTY